MSEPDRITAIAQITDHVAQAAALLMRALRDKPRVAALLAAWVAQVQELETALWALLNDTLATAVGAQLDQLGRLLLEDRLGLDDDSYRAVLKATVLARKSRATAADLCAVLAAMLDGGTFSYAEGTGYVLLSPDDPIPFKSAAAMGPLRLAKAGGVRLELLDPADGTADSFAFAPGEVVLSDANRGLADSTGSTGGKLVGVMA